MGRHNGSLHHLMIMQQGLKNLKYDKTVYLRQSKWDQASHIRLQMKLYLCHNYQFLYAIHHWSLGKSLNMMNHPKSFFVHPYSGIFLSFQIFSSFKVYF